jgi:hypothetical protein
MNKNDIRTNLFIGSLVVAICIYLSFMSFSPFEKLEKQIYKIEMRLDAPRGSVESKVAIVNIDDKSIKELGQWPWPRDIIAEMIEILKKNGAKFISIDMIFSEKEQNPGIEEVKKLYSEILKREKDYTTGEKHTWILAELEEIKKRLDNDKVLSETVENSGNITLPVIGEFGKYRTELIIAPESLSNIRTLKKDTLNIEEYISYNTFNASVPSS